LPTSKDKEGLQRHRTMLAKARARSVLEHDYPKLVAESGGKPTIKDRPPLIYHPTEPGVRVLLSRAQAAFADYRESMQEDRRVLLDRYELKDIAIKVVGIGSVGTFCAVGLMMAGGRGPLFFPVQGGRARGLATSSGAGHLPSPS